METITYYRYRPEIGSRIFRHVGYDDNGDFLFADIVDDSHPFVIRKVDVPLKYNEEKDFDPATLMKTTCGSRMQQVGPWKREENLDYWEDGQSNHDLTCSFCGSCTWEKFLEIINKTIENEHSDVVDFGIERAKDYKFYITQPGVGNASDGAIKFYTWHIPREMFNVAHKEELEDINKKVLQAITIHRKKYTRGF